MRPLVLGIETSCDDTSMALIAHEEGNKTPNLLGHLSFSQEVLLKAWGGVVPEIAARNHMEKLVPLLKTLLEESKISLQSIDLIGVTTHPGLLGPLLTGLNLAKSLSLFLHLPIVPVNHLYAHLEAIHLTTPTSYPYLGLLVSGGHGLFLWVTAPQKFHVVGRTLDDAPGEAFDKGGRLMGLGYPSGRIIDELAQKGDPFRFSFPIGLKNKKNADLSFSGLKTALRYFLDEHPHLIIKQEMTDYSPEFHDLCASYQKAIIDALSLKLKVAIQIVREQFKVKSFPLIVGGGVASNSGLRTALQQNFAQTFFVSPQFCTDNGAMIANYALINQQLAIPYPDSLQLEAYSRHLPAKGLAS